MSESGGHPPGPGTPDPDLPGQDRVRAEVEEVCASRRRVAGEEADQARHLAGAARTWPCTHLAAISAAADEGGQGNRLGESSRWSWEHEPSPTHRRMSQGQVHAGVHGVCWEAVDALAAEVAAREAITTAAATTWICRALAVQALPATATAWALGALGAHQVNTITDELVHLDQELTATADERLCGPADDALAVTAALTTGHLRARVRQVVADLEPAAVRRRSRAETASRKVVVRDLPDGIAELIATGPASDVHSVAAAIRAAGAASKAASRDAAAAGAPSSDPWADPQVDGTGEDARGIDAHRFDALVDIVTTAVGGQRPHAQEHEGSGERCEEGPRGATGAPVGERVPGSGAAHRGEQGSAGAPRPMPSRPWWGAGFHVPDVLIGLTTLLGLDEASAQLEGYGPLPAWMGRHLCRNARLRRFLTDPLTGQLRVVDGHTAAPGTGRDLLDAADAAVREHEADRQQEQRRDDPDPPPDPDTGPGDGGDGGGGGGGRGPSGGPPGGLGAPSAGSDPDPCSREAEPTPTPPCQPVDPRRCPSHHDHHAPGGAGPDDCATCFYTPTADLDRFVRRHWGCCTAPGCRRPAGACDLDHTVPWPTGPTCACNLAPLCRRHHLLKHANPTRGGGPPPAWAQRAGTLLWPWQVHRCTGGHQHWTSPLGTDHTTAPPPPLGRTTRPGGALPPPPQLPTGAGPPPALRYPRQTAWSRVQDDFGLPRPAPAS